MVAHKSFFSSEFSDVEAQQFVINVCKFCSEIPRDMMQCLPRLATCVFS
jgi:hypothetical protein